nr:MAG TPA: hypothetical protein [Caudoviricetes sp.]
MALHGLFANAHIPRRLLLLAQKLRHPRGKRN